MEPGGNIGQVEGSEALFVSVQHGVLPVDGQMRLVQGGRIDREKGVSQQ